MKNQMSKILKFIRICSLIILIFIPIVISSCYVDYGIATNGIPVVASFYNPDYNFNDVTKYYFLDTVVQINGANVTRAYDNTIKNTTINNGCWGGVWSYSSCYSYDTEYEYSTGTIGIVIVDVKVLNGESLPIQWIGLANGVMNSGGNVTQKIIDSINKAFTQSTYL